MNKIRCCTLLLLATIACGKKEGGPATVSEGATASISSPSTAVNSQLVISAGDSVVVTGGDSVIHTGGDSVVVTGGDTVTVGTKPFIKCRFTIEWTQPVGVTKKKHFVLTCRKP